MYYDVICWKWRIRKIFK